MGPVVFHLMVSTRIYNLCTPSVLLHLSGSTYETCVYLRGPPTPQVTVGFQFCQVWWTLWVVVHLYMAHFILIFSIDRVPVCSRTCPWWVYLIDLCIPLRTSNYSSYGPIPVLSSAFVSWSQAGSIGGLSSSPSSILTEIQFFGQCRSSLLWTNQHFVYLESRTTFSCTQQSFLLVLSHPNILMTKPRPKYFRWRFSS